VRLTPRQSLPSNETLLALERVTRIAFAHRRKMIRHTLGQAFSAAELDALGIEMTVRPENLSVAHYVALASLEMTRGHCT
jgi:16S rRNA (adenine1518-N6/adenine1519-N6)-dimethyltransferase